MHQKLASFYYLLLRGILKSLKDNLLAIDNKAEIFPLSSLEQTQKANLVQQIFDLEMVELMDVRQKARVKWAIEGDENSGFFHRTLNHNQRKNFIHGISINGIWISDPKTMQEEAAKFFSSKFNEPLSKRPLFQSNLFKKLEASLKVFLRKRFHGY